MSELDLDECVFVVQAQDDAAVGVDKEKPLMFKLGGRRCELFLGEAGDDFISFGLLHVAILSLFQMFLLLFWFGNFSLFLLIIPLKINLS